MPNIVIGISMSHCKRGGMELPLYKYQGAEDLCLEFCSCPGPPSLTTNSQKRKECWLSSDQLTPFRSRHEGSHRQQRPDLVRPPYAVLLRSRTHKKRRYSAG
jgi:hypothetical protein